MITAVTPTHIHKYLVENGGNAKCRCGQVVKYNQSDNDMRKWTKEVLVEGDPYYRDDKPVAADPPAAAVNQPKYSPPKEYSEYHEWLGMHRDEILQDLDTLGREKTEAKWGITHRSMGQLILAKERAEHIKPRAKVSQIVPEVTTLPEKVIVEKSNHNHDLPPFPAWSNEWEVDVQLRWLDIWKELRDAT